MKNFKLTTVCLILMFAQPLIGVRAAENSEPFKDVSKTTQAAVNSVDSGTEVVVPSGTPIRLTEGGEILSPSAPIGKTVDFKVVNDVLIDGWVVIPSGSLAQGHITEAQPVKINPFMPIRNSMPFMTIALDWVTCADGRKLHIKGELATKKNKYGIGSVLAGNVPDMTASVITPGAAVDVTIMGEAKVVAHDRKSVASKGEFAN